MIESDFFIQGPTSVSYHEENEGNEPKSLYIFGDRHIRIENEDCKKYIRIDEFLKKIAIKSPEKHFHLFIEGIETQIGDEEKNYLMNVINMKTPSNMTKHFLDIRKNYSSYIAFYNFLNICSGLANKSSITREQAEYNFLLLKKFIDEFIYKKDLEKLYEFLTKQNKVFEELIKNEFKKIKNVKLKNRIAELLKQGIEKYSLGTKENVETIIFQILEKIDKGMEYFINIFLTTNKQEIDKIYNDVAEYGQVFMDVYTLCLIMNKEYNNCIIYAGEAHTNVLRKFLFNFTEITKIEQKFINTSEKQCIKLSNDYFKIL